MKRNGSIIMYLREPPDRCLIVCRLHGAATHGRLTLMHLYFGAMYSQMLLPELAQDTTGALYPQYGR